MIDANKYYLEYCLAHSGESINERYRTGRILDDVDSSIPDIYKLQTSSYCIIKEKQVFYYLFNSFILVF